MEYIVGKVVNTHGLKGEVKVQNQSDFERFAVGKSVYIIKDGIKQNLEIKSIRTQPPLYLISFLGIDNINDCLFLKGLMLYSDEKLSTNDDKTYRYDDVIGLKAYTTSNSYIGVVKSLIEVPQGHILEIITDENKKVLVPFIDEFVKEVSDKIVIEPIEGLL